MRWLNVYHFTCHAQRGNSAFRSAVARGAACRGYMMALLCMYSNLVDSCGMHVYT